MNFIAILKHLSCIRNYTAVRSPERCVSCEKPMRNTSRIYDQKIWVIIRKKPLNRILKTMFNKVRNIARFIFYLKILISCADVNPL